MFVPEVEPEKLVAADNERDVGLTKLKLQLDAGRVRQPTHFGGQRLQRGAMRFGGTLEKLQGPWIHGPASQPLHKTARLRAAGRGLAQVRSILPRFCHDRGVAIQGKRINSHHAVVHGLHGVRFRAHGEGSQQADISVSRTCSAIRDGLTRGFRRTPHQYGNSEHVQLSVERLRPNASNLRPGTLYAGGERLRSMSRLLLLLTLALVPFSGCISDLDTQASVDADAAESSPPKPVMIDEALDLSQGVPDQDWSFKIAEGATVAQVYFAIEGTHGTPVAHETEWCFKLSSPTGRYQDCGTPAGNVNVVVSVIGTETFYSYRNAEPGTYNIHFDSLPSVGTFRAYVNVQYA